MTTSNNYPALSTFSLSADGNLVKNGIIASTQKADTGYDKAFDAIRRDRINRNNQTPPAAGAASCPIYGVPTRPVKPTLSARLVLV